MRRIFALLLILTAVFATGIEFTEPSGSYEHGAIPVSLSFEPGQEMRLDLLKNGALVETKTIASPYSTTFEVLNKGAYTMRATARHNGTDYENSTSFEVTTSKIFITIHSPQNKLYYEKVLFEVEPRQDNSFLHGADVSVKIGAETYALPEGQNSYRTEVAFIPGEYTALVSVNGEKVNVPFAIAGEVTGGNETEYLPGLKSFEIKRISPTRSKYSPGESVEISAYLLGQDALRIDEANVSAIIKAPDATEHTVAMSRILVSGLPVFRREYTFAQEGFYEIMIAAESAGYDGPEEQYMPTIKVGEELPSLPADVVCSAGMCIRVESPSEIETYPDGASVTFRVQLIEETTSPISGATVVAAFEGVEIALEYDWNGYYQNTAHNVSQGKYEVSFSAEKGGATIEKNITLHISPDRLVISPVMPIPGGNVTDPFTTIQMKVTDQEGEIVTNTNVRAIVTTPLSGTRTVQLQRNPSTGNYESEYAFSDPGQYTMKIVASKIGHVSSEMIYTFEVELDQSGIKLTEEDVVIAALIIGVLIVIATLWKALI